MTIDLVYSPSDMVPALEAIGYEVKEEKEMVTDRFTDEEKPHVVWNVYRDGEKLVSWGNTGFYRVQWVFKEELAKRLLGLFKMR